MRLSSNRTIFTIYGYPRKISDMLVGTCQLIEQCRLATILVSHQSKGQVFAIR